MGPDDFQVGQRLKLDGAQAEVIAIADAGLYIKVWSVPYFYPWQSLALALSRSL
jgi:hypothetical protein